MPPSWRTPSGRGVDKAAIRYIGQAYATFLANALRPRAQFLSIIGSYGWGCKTVEALAAMIPNLKVEVIDPVLCKGLPNQETFDALGNPAATIADKHREHGFA